MHLKLLKLIVKLLCIIVQNKFRLNKTKSYDCDIILSDPKDAFETMIRISKNEGRKIIHPYEGFKTIQGSATLGYEIYEDLNEIDNIIISVGGGGLISGVGSIIRQKFPNCKIIGVEPEGAASLTASLEKGFPINSFKINTIADSLSPPTHLPISFSICQKVIDQMVLVSDYQMKKAMKFMSINCNLILEPACVAGIAALQGPLKNQLNNQRTLVVLCGANIDMDSWITLTNNI